MRYQGLAKTINEMKKNKKDPFWSHYKKARKQDVDGDGIKNKDEKKTPPKK